MLSLQKTAMAPGVELRETAPPSPPGPGEVIVEVNFAGVCGSDLHIDKWQPSYAFMGRGLPVTLGHEFAGRIVEIGEGVASSRLGERVAVKPASPCGACPACRRGKPMDCSDRRILGLLQNGAFARRVKTSASQCLALPAHVDDRIGALTEPLVIALHAVKDAEVRAGDRVLIFGPGTIGQGAALLARRAGASEIVVVGMNDPHRFATLRAMGFDRLVDLAEEDAGALGRAAGPEGFDCVVEASGSPRAFRDGLAALRPEGVLSAVGIHASPVTFDLTDVVRRRLVIRGSARASHAVWLEVLEALSEDPGLYEKMITHDLPLRDALGGFALGHDRIASKVMLHPDEAL